jgi:prolyl-tRNA synthetase
MHLVSLRGGEDHADDLYDALQGAGISVLYDDRDERPGVKFKDADLIGLPLRLTVSKRSLEQDAVEAKLRTAGERELIPLDDALARASALLQSA